MRLRLLSSASQLQGSSKNGALQGLWRPILQTLRRATIFLTACSLAGPVPAFSQSSSRSPGQMTFARSGVWSVSWTGTVCAMEAQGEYTSVSISRNVRSGERGVSVSVVVPPEYQSGKSFIMAYATASPGVMKLAPAIVRVIRDDIHLANAFMDGEDFLDFVSRGNILSLVNFDEQEPLDSIPLAGSAQAVKQLRMCDWAMRRF